MTQNKTINEQIEELKKEIKVSGDSLTEFWDNSEDDRWDKLEVKGE